MFLIGVSIFTVASAAAALAPSIETLILARALQGIGGAIVAPLTLTILSNAVSPDKRGVALGAWGAIGGLAVALGPLVGGAVTEGLTWQWIFWINVPIGLLLVPLAWSRLTESFGPAHQLDLPGLGLASAGLLGIVWGVIHGNAEGWTSPSIVVPIVAGFAFLVAFVLWERRAVAPMVPPRFLTNKALNRANIASLLMSFGMFGSVFLLSQFLQFAQGYSPFQAGLRVLPWTLAPIFVAPIAGALSDRVGGGLLMGIGLTLQAIGLAWLGLITTATVPYVDLVIPFIISGVGMGLFFAPVANVVLSAVKREEEGQASGVNNAIREIGGVFGVAVLASVFTRYGSYDSPQTFVDGLVPATLIGAAVVAVGAVAAFAIPRRRRAGEEIHVTATHGQPAHPRPGEPEPAYATTDA